MCWYSASAWKHHTLKHINENLPIYPNDPAFCQQFSYVSKDGATSSTSKSTLELPHTEVIHKRAEVAKQFLEEESGQSTFHCPTTEDSGPSHHEAPKHHIKHRPVKSSKKWKEAAEVKANDEEK